MEPWEALDLDDSDLPSLLRPCKRLSKHQPSSQSVTASTHSQPVLKPCSFQKSQSNSLSQRCDSRFEVSSSSSSAQRLIPGPAGAVQAAMQRRTLGDCCFFVSDKEPIPTQEYIRRVIENGDDVNDEFTGKPWLYALDFVRREGLVSGDREVHGTPLRSIKNGTHSDKVDLVVAIIKSCTQNGLGDMVVTLKDPSATLGATIHHGVFSGENGKDVSVGAVLVLQKVATFSPSRSVHYLNITSSNVFKVIAKDSRPPMGQNHPISSVKTPATFAENHENSQMLQKVLSATQGKTDGIMKNSRQNTTRNAQDENKKDQSDAAQDSSCMRNANSQNQRTIIEKELLQNPGTSKEFSSISFSRDTIDGKQDTMTMINSSDCSNHARNGLESVKGSDSRSSLGNFNGDSERTTEVEGTKPVLLAPSIPEWTDEQLDELFSFD